MITVAFWQGFGSSTALTFSSLFIPFVNAATEANGFLMLVIVERNSTLDTLKITHF